MTKRLLKLLSVAAICIFVPYFVFLAVEPLWPPIEHDEPYIFLWLLGTLSIGALFIAAFIVWHAVHYIMYGTND
jgi:hypothetical protein